MADLETFDFPASFDMDAFQRIRSAIIELSSDAVSQHVEMGFSDAQAGSVVAHLFLDAAWACAVTGRFIEGTEPDPEKFIEAARLAVGRLDLAEAKAQFDRAMQEIGDA